MTQSVIPTGVLLVGSLPLSSAEEVLTDVCAALPGRLRYIPDGETGSRWNYVLWQGACFPKETIYEWAGGIIPTDGGRLAYTLDSVQPTGYDEAAISSYSVFKRLRAEGVIPKDVRFQVCLPTPINTVQWFVRPECQSQMEPLYEQRIFEALHRIQESIPANDLAIQWDMPLDVMALEHDRGTLDSHPMRDFFKLHFSPVKEGLLDRIIRLCKAVDADIELGFHLCYGDYEHKHLIEPTDLGLMVMLANEIVKRVGPFHPVAWLHMPVPKDRTDIAYFEPLDDLKLDDTQLFLGLVHANDEVGTQERIKVAQSVWKGPFGVATECGMGRTPKEELDSIFQISRNVTRPY